MGNRFALFRVVDGCHDCPILEVSPFGRIQCPYVPFPADTVVDQFTENNPPHGCPLLHGGMIVLTLRDAPEAPNRTRTPRASPSGSPSSE